MKNSTTVDSNRHESQSRLNRRQQVNSLYWSNVISVVTIHLLAILGPWYFSWSGLGIMAVGWWVCGGLGICLCYDRLLTHRSYKTFKFVEYVLTVCGTLNWEGSPIRWVGQHRLHHLHSDKAQDPHTPTQGFDWSHILWLFWDDPADASYKSVSKDLLRDSFHRFLDKFHLIPNILLGVALYCMGRLVGGEEIGLSWIVYGIGVRGVFIYHATWMVNSIGHTIGYQSWKTGDNSRNNWFVALLSFGEGWHNNHHASPRSAAHGLKLSEPDVTFMTIRLMNRLGLAWDIQPFREPK